MNRGRFGVAAATGFHQAHTRAEIEEIFAQPRQIGVLIMVAGRKGGLRGFQFSGQFAQRAFQRIEREGALRLRVLQTIEQGLDCLADGFDGRRSRFCGRHGIDGVR